MDTIELDNINYLDKKNIDMIINLAAYTNVDRAEIAMKQSNEVNNRGVYLLASKAIKRNIELIHFSRHQTALLKLNL